MWVSCATSKDSISLKENKYSLLIIKEIKDLYSSGSPSMNIDLLYDGERFTY